MKKKKCNKCQQSKSLQDFHKASKNTDGRYHTCKLCRQNIDKLYYKTSNKRAGNKLYRKKVRHTKNEIKNNAKCYICGEGHGCCLDFHHLNPDNKLFNIGKTGTQGGPSSIPQLLREVEKCVILCSNCHRKVHAGILVLPADSGIENTNL